MDYTKTGTQTKSLVVSITGHCGLIALCAYLSYSVNNIPSTHQRAGSKPASVSWLPGSGDGRAADSGFSENSQEQRAQSAPIHQDHASEKTADGSETIVIPDQPGTEEDTIQSQEPTSAQKDRAPGADTTESQSARPSAMEGYGPAQHSDYMPNQGTMGQPTKRKITGAAFMGAFKQSMRAEAAQQATARSYGGNGTGSAGTGNGPAHVQERIDEWQWAHYNEKVWRALVKSAKIFKKYVRTPTAVHEVLTVPLILDKQGKVKNIGDIPKVGIADVDDFIKEFFLTTDFPSIPQRLPINEREHRITISLRMSEGGHYMYLEPSHE